VDCNDVFAEVLRNLKLTLEEHAASVTHTELPIVQGDRTQLVQLFQNLLGNGIKFHGDTPPRVHVAAERVEGRWQFSVHDNGIGIESEYAETVFEIFQRLHTSDAYPGTGIGLAVCKRIVDRHEGRIWFESVVGQGTTFFFTLPALEAPTVAA
jgi:light-regulated signal transduction histidine kinase (bacteriophytochrome)